MLKSQKSIFANYCTINRTAISGHRQAIGIAVVYSVLVKNWNVHFDKIFRFCSGYS